MTERAWVALDYVAMFIVWLVLLGHVGLFVWAVFGAQNLAAWVAAVL